MRIDPKKGYEGISNKLKFSFNKDATSENWNKMYPIFGEIFKDQIEIFAKIKNIIKISI